MTAIQLGWVMASDLELGAPDGVGLPDQGSFKSGADSNPFVLVEMTELKH